MINPNLQQAERVEEVKSLCSL